MPKLPVHADGHKDRAPEPGPPDVPQPPDFPSAPPHQDHGDCHCHVSAGGGIAKLKAEVGDRPEPGEIDVDSAFDNQQQRDDWRKQRKDRPVFQAYVGTVELTFRINATTVQAQGTDAGEMQIHRTTRVKVSLGSAWDFQVFRKGNTGFLPIDGRTENEALRCPNGTVTFKEISGEYRIELWRKSQTDAIPDKTSIDVDVSVGVDPCGHEAHEKATYWLGFAKTGEVKMLHSVERMP